VIGAIGSLSSHPIPFLISSAFVCVFHLRSSAFICGVIRLSSAFIGGFVGVHLRSVGVHLRFPAPGSRYNLQLYVSFAWVY
jgi:hypothetical protein